MTTFIVSNGTRSTYVDAVNVNHAIELAAEQFGDAGELVAEPVPSQVSA